jgi:hypothetical protein
VAVIENGTRHETKKRQVAKVHEAGARETKAMAKQIVYGDHSRHAVLRGIN